MSRIWTIAVNTFREAIRDKILYNLLFFALAVMLVSISLSSLTISQPEKIVVDVGLGAMSIFGLLIAIFVGIQLVFKEIQRRTIYVLLAKPVRRWEFLLGKYLGLALTIALNLGVMTAVLILILEAFTPYVYQPLLLAGILLIFVELLLVTAVALFFSTFSTPTLSAMFTLGIYVIGHLSADLKAFGAASKNGGLRIVTSLLYYLLPNLENFNLKTEVANNLALQPGFIAAALAYGLTYLVVLLLGATVIFQGRDFK